jgi:hypothetical protein
MNSRPAPEEIATMPYKILFEQANKEAQQAELLLLRNLLAKAYNALQNTAIRARSDGKADDMIERLMRDILITLDKVPAVLGTS